MKADELMVGNYVKSGSNDFPVTEIKEDRVTGFNNNCIYGRLYMHLDAIPLTEQWLIDFGFEYFEFRNTYLRGDIFLSDISDYEINFQLGIRTKLISWLPVYVKHVHQLQNLYFTLTGKKLIKTK